RLDPSSALLGHRESVDFDFFSEKRYNASKILDELKSMLLDDEAIEIKEQDADTLIIFINSIKISFFFYNHKLLDSKIKLLDNIKLASVKDIFAMKLIAISQRGTKKDFIDMYFLLNNGFEMFDAVQVLNEKYEKVKFNKLHILKSFSYFDDADLDAEPKMLKKVSWQEVKNYIQNKAKSFLKELV
ncbi:MAG: nucleotidyl transferase AbiEii/AbiGii toxin family protein, partial [Bdellovibrionota bacterium]